MGLHRIDVRSLHAEELAAKYHKSVLGKRLYVPCSIRRIIIFFSLLFFNSISWRSSMLVQPKRVTIDHGILLKLLEEKISDSRIIGLIRAFLIQGVMKELVLVERNLGSPQGGVLSPLLANIYLHEFDKVMGEYGIHLIRYVDGFLVLVSSQEEVEMALEITKQWMSGFHLSLHPEKTRICNLNNFKEECQFLGYIFYLSERGYFVHLTHIPHHPPQNLF